MSYDAPIFKQHDIPFEELIPSRHPRSNSGQGQESFVLNVLEDKSGGYYVEVGSHHPRIANNTYILEKEFGWRGLAVEIDSHYAERYNKERSNKCVNADALTFDYLSYFKENNFPKSIDYLQIDVDDTPRHANLLALIQLPLSEYRFKVITIEHDSSRDFTLDKMRDSQRLILHSLGYELVVQGHSEDFWVDRMNVDYKNYWCLHRIGSYF
jgi:hypothetical protein